MKRIVSLFIVLMFSMFSTLLLAACSNDNDEYTERQDLKESFYALGYVDAMLDMSPDAILEFYVHDGELTEAEYDLVYSVLSQSLPYYVDSKCAEYGNAAQNADSVYNGL